MLQSVHLRPVLCLTFTSGLNEYIVEELTLKAIYFRSLCVKLYVHSLRLHVHTFFSTR